MKQFIITLIIALLILNNNYCWTERSNVIELNKLWSLTNQNGTITIVNITLPSGVYSALCGENVLNGWNDVNMRWIAYDNWTYTHSFSVSSNDLKYVGHINLTLHGIDTIADITLNGYLLGRTDNMFVRYSYNVQKLLSTQNTLEIALKSPVFAALEKANELKARRIEVVPNCPPESYNGECHINLLRKMQASFGWDWGLAVPSIGIWKSVVLEYFDVAMIRDIDVAIHKNETHWLMHNRVFIDCIGQMDFSAELTFYAVELLEAPLIIDYAKSIITCNAPIIEFDVALEVNKVTMWWPNGYGEQKLYPLHYALKAWLHANYTPRNFVKSKKSIQVGFRTVELVEKPVIEGTGNTFLFKVNGIEIFMKGSNYIPSHIQPEYSKTIDRINHLLLSAKEGHQNMLRVWGGGIYESDEFYDLADKYGLLIWQDMMFACAMYPVTEDFLASVSTEVLQNIKRIIHHPSVIIIATNNENELALVDNWYGTVSEKERYEREYRELYLGTIMHELKAVEYNGRPILLVSSPSNGKESSKDNYISSNPQDPNYGDVHFYEYFKDSWDINIYPRPRFASEYGFQGLPTLAAWYRTMTINETSTNSLQQLISHRQHHPLGMSVISSLVRRHFPLPLPEDLGYTEALIYLSQVAQAMSTKIETELYRSLRGTRYRTMGALYWQLNDVWVTPSWSSIDFYGNFKLLHYWSKEFFEPIRIITLYDRSSQMINVSIVCDKLKMDTNHLQVTLNVYKWSDLVPRSVRTWPATMKLNGVHYDKVIPIKDILKDDFTVNNSFMEFVLSQNKQRLSHNYVFPSSFTDITNVKKPHLEMELSQKYCALSDKHRIISYSITITTQYPAIFVYIELTRSDIHRYKLSRNGFMQLTPVQMIHLDFASHECVNLTVKDFKLTTVNQYLV